MLAGRPSYPLARGHNGGVSQLYRDEAVVLRTQKLGEADRIVTFLTRESGRVRAVGKGVRRTKSKFGSRLEPFMQVDVQFAHGRSLDVVTQVETIAPYGHSISNDYARYTAGTAMLETAERLVTEEKEPSVQHFLLLVGGLRAMAAKEQAASQVLDSYLLRSLAVAGYAPSFDHCTSCGIEGPHRYFNPSAGGVLCVTCKIPGSASPAQETIRALAALLTGDWASVRATDPRHLREASTLVSAYLSWHLERGLRSMAYVER